MCRLLAYVLMLCLILPLPVLSAPNPNENALENASDSARFNREDDVKKGKREKTPGDDDGLDKKDREGKKERDGKKEKDSKKSKGGKNKKK
jgi:hypothetical protein